MEKQNKISLGFAIIIGLNAVIGAGIFSVPAALATSAGPAGLITYALVIAAVLCIALSLATMSLRFPTSSIFYDHTALWASKKIALATTGIYVIGLATALGLLAKLLGIYLAQEISLFSAPSWSLIAIALCLFLNIAGQAILAAGHLIFFALTILPLVVITGMGLYSATPTNLVPFAPFGVLGILKGIKAVAFGFFGFEVIPAIFSRMENPEKNTSRAIIATIIITGCIYTLFTAALMLGIPQAYFTSADEPLSAILISIYPSASWLIRGITWSIIITIAGTINSMLGAVSTLMSATYQRIQPQAQNTSTLMLFVLAFMGAILSMSLNNISLFFSIVSITFCLAYASTIVPLVLKNATAQRTTRLLGWMGIAGCMLLIGCAFLGVFGN